MRLRAICSVFIFAGTVWSYDLAPIQEQLEQIKTQLDTLKKPYSERAIQGRINQAWIYFENHEYGKALFLLTPFLETNDPQVLALAGHSEFELGNYLAAGVHLSLLSDQTSLYRMIQIEDKLGNFTELKKYYSKIKNPPDFIKYIYARQLILNNQGKEASALLQEIPVSSDYFEKAQYVRAIGLVQNRDYTGAQAIFKSLEASHNLQLAELAKVNLARLYYELGQPNQAISIYEKLYYPDELAKSQILAGDSSQDLKIAQQYYKSAESNAVDKSLWAKSLFRQNKNEEARIAVKGIRDSLVELKSKIQNNDSKLLQEDWIQNQPELSGLGGLQDKIAVLRKELQEVQLEYELFEVDAVGQFESDKSLLTQLAFQLELVSEELSRCSGAEFQLNLNNKLNFAYKLKAVNYEIDGVTLTQTNLQKIAIGQHQLRVTAVYQINSGEVTSSLNYKLSAVYPVQVSRGEVLTLEIVLENNPEEPKKIKLGLAKSVDSTNLPLLDQLRQQQGQLLLSLRRAKSTESEQMTVEIVAAKSDIESLKSELQSLSSEFEKAKLEVFEKSKPTWLVRLESDIYQDDLLTLNINQAERLKLSNRISQIEQLKSGELRKETLSGHSAEEQHLKEITQESQAIRKVLKDNNLKKVQAYYDDNLTELKAKEAKERKLAIEQLESFIKRYPQVLTQSEMPLLLADLYYDDDLSQTIKYLELFINNQPNALRVDAAYYLLGLSYLYEGDTERSKSTFEQFIARGFQSEYSDEVKFRLAEIYFEEKDYSKAKFYFAQLAEHPKTNFGSKSLYKTAWIDYLQNDFHGAVDGFQKVLNEHFGTNEILMQEGARYLALSILEVSKTPVQEGIERHVGYDTFVALGNALAKREKNSEAALAFEQAIALSHNEAKNQELEFKVLSLTPSLSVKRNLVRRYIDNPAAREFVKPVLLDLAIQTYAEAKKSKDKQHYKEAALDFAQFIRYYPEYAELDEIVFYYAESSFDADLYDYAAKGFEQVRDWPQKTQYRERAAINLVYAYTALLKSQLPEVDFSQIELAQKGRYSGKLSPAMEGYIRAVDVIGEKYPGQIDYPAWLFQTASIYFSYGKSSDADERFKRLIQLYPKSDASRVAANILVADLVASEKWGEAAQEAKKYETLGSEFGDMNRNARFKEASLLYAQAKSAQEYARAADLYASLLKDHPTSEVADKILYNAGKALDQAHLYEQAEKLFAQLVSLYPSSPLSHSVAPERASYFEQRLLFEKAAEVYLKIKNDSNALLQAALDYEAAAKYRTAGVLFERFIREYPKATGVLEAYQKAIRAYALADDQNAEQRVKHEMMNRYKGQSAEVDYEALAGELTAYFDLKLDAKSSKAQSKQLVSKSEKLAKLQKSYEQIVKKYDLSSWSLASLYQVGRLYQSLFNSLIKAPCPDDVQKLSDDACDEYTGLLEDKAIILEKKATDAYRLVLSKASSVPGSSHWVLQAKQSLFQMKPSENLPVERLFSQMLVSAVPEQLADKSILVKTLEEDPWNFESRLQMAKIYYLEGAYQAAQLVLEDSIEKGDQSALAQLWLGHVYLAEKNTKQAILAYEKSDMPEAFDNLGVFYLEQGNFSKAFENLEKAKHGLPKSALVHLHLGNYYFEVADFMNALHEYQIARKLDPNLLAIDKNIAFIYFAQSDYEKASHYFEAFLKGEQIDAALKTRVESYLKLTQQRLKLGKTNL